jgi:hypothetical protein
MSSLDSNFYHDDPVDFDEVPRKRKFSSVLALLALFAGAGFYVQTTLASNISLNTGAPVEFGQGVTQTTSCTGDSILTLTPTSTFVNASAAGSFYFKSVTVSGIPATSRQYDFTINAYGNTDQAPLSIFNTNSKTATIYNNAGTFSLGTGSTGMSKSSASGTFTATFTNLVAPVSSVYKIVIQCGPHQVELATISSPLKGDWNGVTFGGGKFVAVGWEGKVATSSDGDNWTTGTTANQSGWNSVTYGGGTFVAVSSNGNSTQQVVSSTDGINWDTRTIDAGGIWTSVTYGNGIFVAVSSTGSTRVITSPDGITWTNRTSPGSPGPYWSDVTYGNETFVAVAYGGTGARVMTSPDGITWTSRTPAENAVWRGVTYGNGKFVAVGEQGNIMTSSDGITWAPQNLGGDLVDIGFGNNLFVAVGGGGKVMTSSDGITWDEIFQWSYQFWLSVTYGNGKFVSVGTSVGTNPFIGWWDPV